MLCEATPYKIFMKQKDRYVKYSLMTREDFSYEDYSEAGWQTNGF
jgi:hypothetical protein